MKTRKRLRDEARKKEQMYIDDDYLYDLLFAEKWEPILSLLAFKTRQHEKVLRALISERQNSPLWIIVNCNNFLCDSAKAVCLRLIEIGGKEIVCRTGFEERDPLDQRYTTPGSTDLLTDITVLHCACRTHHWWDHGQIDNENLLEVIDQLLEVGGEEYLFMTDSDGQTAWQIVCERGTGKNDINIVRRLLEVGGEKILFSVSQDAYKRTALHKACYLYQGPPCVDFDVDVSKCITPEIVHFLIHHGGEKLVFMKDSQGSTPLNHACSAGRGSGPEIISRLLEIGGKKLALMTDKWNRSPLEMAFNSNSDRIEEIVDLLIKVGGKSLVYNVNYKGNSALHVFFNLRKGNYGWREREEIWLRLVRKLLDVGGEKLLMLENMRNRTAVLFLCRNRSYGNSKILQELIKVGGEKILKQRDIRGLTVLHAVCNICNHEQSPEMANVIIGNGGAEVVFSQNCDGYTPLHVACRRVGSSSYRLEVINQLLDAGRQRILFQKSFNTIDTEAVTAIQFEGWNSNPCQKVIDRFIEVGGEKAANLIRG